MHAPYIKKCIEGVLMQDQTYFQLEYVIADDGSTDGTKEIVSEYARKYPDIIKLLTSDKNLGVMANAGKAFRAITGKYVAQCEGDDYWTDPYKLQKQVSFLEEHLDYSACYHNSMIEYEDGRPSHVRGVKPWDSCTLEELILNFNDITYPGYVTAGHTSSMVFRNGLIKAVPPDLAQMMSGDILMQILLAQHGKAKFINEVMSTHRIHTGGISSSHSGFKLYENRIMMYEGLKKFLDQRYEKVLDQVLVMYYSHVGNLYYYRNKYQEAFYSYRKAFGGFKAMMKMINFRFFVEQYIRPFLVRVYRLIRKTPNLK